MEVSRNPSVTALVPSNSEKFVIKQNSTEIFIHKLSLQCLVSMIAQGFKKLVILSLPKQQKVFLKTTNTYEIKRFKHAADFLHYHNFDNLDP